MAENPEDPTRVDKNDVVDIIIKPAFDILDEASETFTGVNRIKHKPFYPSKVSDHLIDVGSGPCISRTDRVVARDGVKRNIR